MDSLKNLPPWVWVVVIAGAIGIGWFTTRGSSAAAQTPADTSTTQQQQPPTTVINLPTPPDQPPTNTLNLPQFYTVKAGDHEADVLSKFGISQTQLESWNCPVYPALCQGHFFVGWVLRVG